MFPTLQALPYIIALYHLCKTCDMDANTPTPWVSSPLTERYPGCLDVTRRAVVKHHYLMSGHERVSHPRFCSTQCLDDKCRWQCVVLVDVGCCCFLLNLLTPKCSTTQKVLCGFFFTCWWVCLLITASTVGRGDIVDPQKENILVSNWPVSLGDALRRACGQWMCWADQETAAVSSITRIDA